VIVPIARKWFVDNVCTLTNTIGKAANDHVSWCDYFVPDTRSVPFVDPQGYNFQGPYQTMAFEDTVATGRPPAGENLVYQEHHGKTLDECKQLCDQGLTGDTSGFHSRHGNWKGYAKCYGFKHLPTGADIDTWRARNAEYGYHGREKYVSYAQVGTCEVGTCSANRGRTRCHEGKCLCDTGHYTTDGSRCTPLPDFTNGRPTRPSDAGTSLTNAGGTCRNTPSADGGACSNTHTGKTVCTTKEQKGHTDSPLGHQPGRRRRRRRAGGLCEPAWCECAPGWYAISSGVTGSCIEKPSTKYAREKMDLRIVHPPSEPSSSGAGACTLFGKSRNVPYYGKHSNGPPMGQNAGNLWIASHCTACNK
jgi:hypothetical protein